MQRAKFFSVSPNVTLIDDAGEASCYLVTGEKKAALIDTANGKEDLKKAVRSLTDLPLIVINTHGHCDHVFGNVFFDEAFVHDADRMLLKEQFLTPQGREVVERTGRRPCSLQSICPGDVIDLGGRVLEVFGVPGHTRGSIVLLEREERLLFSGDAFGGHLWMQLEESTDISEMMASIRVLEPIRSAFDRFCTGHECTPVDAALIDEILIGARELLDGKTENDKDYKWFRGVAKRHDYGTHGRCIVYDPARELR